MAKRKSKYGAVPTVVDGIRFASKAEAKRDGELQILVKAGDIFDLKRQPRFKLLVRDTQVGTYVGDWFYLEYTKDGRRVRVVEDKKGYQTKEFKLKWALVKALHPEIEWRLS